MYCAQFAWPPHLRQAHVVRLEVSVDDVAGVKAGESAGGLLSDAHPILPRQLLIVPPILCHMGVGGEGEG